MQGFSVNSLYFWCWLAGEFDYSPFTCTIHWKFWRNSFDNCNKSSAISLQGLLLYLFWWGYWSNLSGLSEKKFWFLLSGFFINLFGCFRLYFCRKLCNWDTWFYNCFRLYRIVHFCEWCCWMRFWKSVNFFCWKLFEWLVFERASNWGGYNRGWLYIRNCKFV